MAPSLLSISLYPLRLKPGLCISVSVTVPVSVPVSVSVADAPELSAFTAACTHTSVLLFIVILE